jgi:phosphatidylethanolamine/phosphatidyl-N-methylethanolamine N-methyltransferase
MDTEAIKVAYRRYARVYDALFGPIFQPGREQIVRTLDCRPGDSVLEVGVGTGLSLPLYPSDVKLTGIDLSAEMLAKAQRRVARHDLSHVDALLQMDAEHTSFADESFDKVVAMYLVSVVPDPVRLVDEMRRVCRPGGEIFIVNHFHSRNRVVGGFENLLSPMSKLVGFHPNLDLNGFIRATRLDVIEMHSANLFGYWKVLRCRRAPQSGPGALLN